MKPVMVKATATALADTPAAHHAARTRIAARVVGEPSQPPALHVDYDCQPAPGADDWRRMLRDGQLAQTQGLFALAHEEADGTVTLARDAIGERSLYYAVLPGGRIIYASRLQDIMASGHVARELDTTSVATYLSWSYLPGRETLVRGVYKVMPGEVVRFKNGSLTRSAWWSLPGEPDIWRDESALCGELRERLEAAVQRRLPAGQAVGATLSGGIDSSLVVALAARLHDAPVIAYSVSFGDEYRNELPFSARVARHCGVEQRIVELTPRIVVDELDRTIAMLGDPIGDPLTVPKAVLFREVAGDTGVVLNGEGGGPCFGGPKNTPMVLAELFGELYSDESRQRTHRAASYLRAHQKCYDDLGAMLAPDVRESMAPHSLEDWVTPYLEDPRWKSFVGCLMSINLLCKGAHHILGKVDALSGPLAGIHTRRGVKIWLLITLEAWLRRVLKAWGGNAITGRRARIAPCADSCYLPHVSCPAWAHWHRRQAITPSNPSASSSAFRRAAPTIFWRARWRRRWRSFSASKSSSITAAAPAP